MAIVGVPGLVGLLALLKKLRGRKLRQVVQITETRTTRIEVEGEMLDVSNPVWRLFENWRARKAAEELIRPVRNEGIETFKIVQNDQALFETNKSEADFFNAPETSEDEKSHEHRVKLRIVSPSFRPNNKWRLWDGAKTFWAMMEDAQFQRRVQEGREAFRTDDMLDVLLKTTERLENGESKVEFTISRVFKHASAPTQKDLLPPIPPDAENPPV